MVVGVCIIQLHLPQSDSLKAKRRLLNSIKGRVRNKFNITIAEVDNNELWQRATLGAAYLHKDKQEVERVLAALLEFIEGLHLARLIDCRREILYYNAG